MTTVQNGLSCRNCISHNTITLNQGTVAPFFLKRVHNVHVMSLGEQIYIKLTLLSPNTLFKKILKFSYTELNNSTLGTKLFKFRSPAKVDIFVCKDCGFICPAHIYEASQLLRLYSDYRSESYNLERAFFEPKYRHIMNLVGKSEDEIRNRLDNVGSLIRKYTKLESIETVLDWGGGEGKFIPRELRNKKVFILDVSNEKLAEPTFTRIEQPATNQKFDFIQVCHVLEHVSSPHDFLKNTLPYLNLGGYLYLEVPQDRTEEDIQRFIKSDSAAIHKIHEHLNLYSVQSIKALANSLELKELIVEKKEFNFGREKLTIVSGLFMKI